MSKAIIEGGTFYRQLSVWREMFLKDLGFVDQELVFSKSETIPLITKWLLTSFTYGNNKKMPKHNFYQMGYKV